MMIIIILSNKIDGNDKNIWRYYHHEKCYLKCLFCIYRVILKLNVFKCRTFKKYSKSLPAKKFDINIEI